MIEYIFTLKNKNGLHSRPASLLTKFSKLYSENKIYIIKDDKKAEINSLISILALSAKPSDNLSFQIEGREKEKVLDELKKILDEINNMD